MFFFVPTLDEYELEHFAYVAMSVSNASDVFSGKVGDQIDLTEYAEILHAEPGYWPTKERHDELCQFYCSEDLGYVHATSQRLAA